MTLRYQDKKEFYGYNRETMLIFSDNDIKIEYPLLEKILKLYNGNSGEVIDFRILYDEIKDETKILLIIICFKTLIVDVSEKEYSKFIQMHKNRFIEYYNKVMINF